MDCIICSKVLKKEEIECKGDPPPDPEACTTSIIKLYNIPPDKASEVDKIFQDGAVICLPCHEKLENAGVAMKMLARMKQWQEMVNTTKNECKKDMVRSKEIYEVMGKILDRRMSASSLGRLVILEAIGAECDEAEEMDIEIEEADGHHEEEEEQIIEVIDQQNEIQPDQINIEETIVIQNEADNGLVKTDTPEIRGGHFELIQFQEPLPLNHAEDVDGPIIIPPDEDDVESVEKAETSQFAQIEQLQEPFQVNRVEDEDEDFDGPIITLPQDDDDSISFNMELDYVYNNIKTAIESVEEAEAKAETSQIAQIGQLQCKVCSKRLSSKVTLAQHETIHGERLYKCPHCSRDFITKILLKAHLKNNTPSECTTCKETFKTSGCLSQHEWKVHGKGPYAIIGARGERGSVSKFFTRMEGGKFKCIICSSIGKNPAQHIKIHKPERFTCPVKECGVKYVYKHNIKHHLMTAHKKDFGKIMDNLAKRSRE